MVQNSERKRGRPRAYDPTVALSKAMGAFWGRGYAATSLDDISAATGMNRPSLYAAFGDKRAIYLKALHHYGAGTALRDGLGFDEPLRDALARAYRTALAVYLSEENGARGCFVIGTAATEAVADPDVRKFLGDLLLEIDAGFEARIRRAKEEGELPDDADPAALAKIASAALFSLAIRSRAGETRAELEKTAAAAVDMICSGGDLRPFSRREKVAAERPDEGHRSPTSAPMAAAGSPHPSPSATPSPSGRRGPKPATRLARRLRRTQTSAEDLLWRELRDRRLDGWKFRRQAPIAGHVVDFACVAAKLAIEVDGKHHAEQIAEDSERSDKIAAAGYLEIRFTNDEVRGRLHWVIEEIQRTLDVARGREMRDPAFRLD